MLTFHRPRDACSPDDKAENTGETKARDAEERNCGEEITVKEEIVSEIVADEEEEINVDEQVEENDQKANKETEIETKLKTELVEESVPEKMKS